MGERGMRCEDCGTVWYSAIATITSQWARCFSCGGRLHIDRRSRRDRRDARGGGGLVAGT